MFYSNQLDWLIKAEVATHVAHELLAVIGAGNLPEQVQDRLQAEVKRHQKEREKWENKLQKAFGTT